MSSIESGRDPIEIGDIGGRNCGLLVKGWVKSLDSVMIEIHEQLGNGIYHE